ncbi:Uncharacterised protein [Vibrio cholerae]|nr:Uncharacterised protein [Vibrio cholerae]
MRNQRFITLAQFFIPFEDFMHFGVSQASVRVHYRFVMLVARELTRFRYGHFTHHAQAIDLWVE